MTLRNFLRAVLYLTLCVTFITAYTGLKINSYANQFSNTSSDAAIILGAAVWNDQPSPVFQARIDHAINLHNNGRVKFLIFTGGIGHGQKIAESEAAKNYAMKHGINSQDILIETHSKITFENLTAAKALLKDNQLQSVLLVSDPLHMKRAMVMATDLDIQAAPSPTPTSLYISRRKKIGFLVRETFYYIGYLITR